MLNKFIRLVGLLCAVQVLVACVGSDSGSSQPTSSLSGVAAVGAPMGDATITLRDVNGKTISVAADAEGEYKISDLTGFVAPFQITASAQMGDRMVVHHAIVPKISGEQTANINQLTTAVISLLIPSAVIGELSPSQLAAMSESSIQRAYDTIKTVLKPLTDKLVGITSFDPLTTRFKANGEGVDSLLEHIAVNTRDGYIELSNKMAALSDTNTSVTVVIGKTAGFNVQGVLDNSTIQPANFKDLLDKFTRCFAVSETLRLTNKTMTSATLNPACSDLAVPDYVQFGASFKLRWAGALNSNTMNTTAGAKFNSIDIRLLNNQSPLRLVVNINYQDSNGVGYTMPEIIEKQADGTWKLYGNRRNVMAYVDASLKYWSDMTVAPNNYNNVNFSQLESGLRFTFDPRVTFDPITGESDIIDTIDYRTPTGYKNSGASFSTINNNKGAKTITQCVVVTGPGKFMGANWMGLFPHGLMFKRPVSSSVQDFMSIDRRLSSTQKTALDNTALNDTVSIANFCDNGTNSGQTDRTYRTYVVESVPLLNQIHPLTGEVSTAMNGRDVRWNIGLPNTASMKPDADLAKTFDNNPVFTFYVIDSDNKLRMKFNVRLLGELPPASVAKDLADSKMLSIPTKETISKYLDFSATGIASLNNLTSVDATWTTKPGAYATDVVGFYSEVTKSRPRPGLRGPLSVHSVNQGLVADSRWDTDAELAAALDAATGINYSNSDYGLAKEKSSGSCPADTAAWNSAKSIANVSQFGIGRRVQAMPSRNLDSGSVIYGLNGLADACLGTTGTTLTDASVYREFFTRTYSEKNVILIHATANRAFRQ